MTVHPRPAEFNTAISGKKAINLALQGGGSHGAFTWGVLDRLLEEDQLTFDGITATSAGSINAVVMAYGLSIGGRDAAKKLLQLFWRRMSAIAASSVFQPSILDKMSGKPWSGLFSGLYADQHALPISISLSTKSFQL